MLRVAGLALLASFMVEAFLRGAFRSGPAPDRSPRSPAARAGIAMDMAVAAWTLTAIASTLAGVSPHLAMLGEIEQREGLLTTLALAGLYAGTRGSHRVPADARRTLGMVAGCGALAAAYALLQIAGLDPLAWANAPTYLEAPRVFGTLGNPILLGNLLAAALAAAVARLACGGAGRLGLAPQVALIAGAAAATLSRGAWLAAAAGVGAALASGLAAGGAGARRRVGFALAVVATPVALWAVVMRAPLIARLTEVLRADAVSGAARAEIARGALALWRTHPWLGTGPDSFGLMFPSVRTAVFWWIEWIGAPVHAHSVALQTLATLGTLGALAGLAWVAALGWALSGARRSTIAEPALSVALGATALALVVAGTVNPVGLAGAACFAVLSALAAGGSELRRSGSNNTAASAPLARGGEPGAVPRADDAPTDAAMRRERASSVIALAAGLVTALVVALAGEREMRALAAAGRARSALERASRARPEERGAFSEPAVRNAERAAALAAGEDELWRLACDANLERAEAAIARRDLEAAGMAAASAAEAAGRALRLTPRRASNHERLGNALLMRARVAAALGPGEGAVAALADSADLAFGEAIRLAPADGLILTAQARGQLLLRRPERALAAAQRITALYPAAATGHALEAAALLSLGRSQEAREALILARDARWEDGAEPQRRAVEDLLRAFARADSAR